MRSGTGYQSTKGDPLYLQLESRNADTVTLTGLRRPIKSAKLLETGEALAVDDVTKSIALPATLPDPVVSVIVVELGA